MNSNGEIIKEIKVKEFHQIMGNVFDSSNEKIMGDDPHSHQQLNNNHIRRKTAPPKENDCLTKEENNGITEQWNKLISLSKLSNNDNDNDNDNNSDVVKEAMTDLFISPYLVDLYIKSCKDNVFDVNHVKKFVRLLTRETSRDAIQCIWLLLNDDNENYKNKLISFFRIILEISINDHDNDEITKVSLLLTEMLMKYMTRRKSNQMYDDNNDDNNSTVALDDVINWCNEYAPFIPKLLETTMTNAFFSSIYQPSYRPFYPVLLADKSDIVSVQQLLPLALYSSSCQGQWKRLYTTQTDGWAFNRISHHILGYAGPTCIIFKSVIDRVPNIFGSFNEERWKDSNSFFGSSRAFLFTISPKLQILRNKNGSNNNYQWLNTRTYGKPHGIGMGGSTDEFRIFIPDSMENCYASPACLTFESGKLITRPLVEGTNEFRIDALEIWACGGTELIKSGLNAQKKYKDNVDNAIKKAQKCDKAAFFGNAFDQEMFLSKTMAHKQHAQERSDV